MPCGPLHELDSIAVRVHEPRNLRAVRTARPFDGTGRDAGLPNLRQGRVEILHLDRQVAEPGTDLNAACGRLVFELERDYVFARKLEHGQSGLGTQLNLADLLIAERHVEPQGRGQVADAQGNMKRPQRSDISSSPQSKKASADDVVDAGYNRAGTPLETLAGA